MSTLVFVAAVILGISGILCALVYIWLNAFSKISDAADRNSFAISMIIFFAASTVSSGISPIAHILSPPAADEHETAQGVFRAGQCHKFEAEQGPRREDCRDVLVRHAGARIPCRPLRKKDQGKGYGDAVEEDVCLSGKEI